MSKGILLVNLGSPDSTAVGDVRKYLRQFLMDGRVIDAPWPIRFGIVHFTILPFRPKESAHAYQKIWTPEGSPLVVTSRHVQHKLQERFTIPVELAMRYQNPSIESAIRKLDYLKVDDVFLIPLFPHYAMSSYESAVERVKSVAKFLAPKMKITVQPPYFDAPDYIEALVTGAQNYLQDGYDHLLFSFHGIPERHLRKSDPTGCHCLRSENCCEVSSPAHATCYRAQCFKTVAAFVAKANVPKEKYSVSFQSRLGRDPWLKPYTDLELAEFPKRGVQKLLVICPAFVSDCLETIEEIGMRGKETFISAGGKEFMQIPCLNEQTLWLSTLEKMARTFLH
ncbi:MAG TPA: ferrochelatase [Candidatus Acidoferrum sp.]|jgi:ferrochelatase|nr:ferrochelatase [Candidatus Acidoferrum sp.]